ncbi:MAG: hypothetical protein JSS87_05280 [Acidobacteria bacterium]|nr:hypothetical protein [Acidobacteriota bacterium]
MKIRSVLRPATALLVTVAALALVACGDRPYHQTDYNFAGRVTPPSQLDYRVAITVTGSGIAGTGGSMEIVDALRDIRYSVFNVNQTFRISGFAFANATRIFSYPEQQIAFVYNYTSQNQATINTVDYGKEQSVGQAASLGSKVSDVFVPSDGAYVYAAQETTGTFIVSDRTALKSANAEGVNYNLSLPGVYKIAVNPSHTVVLAMVRNSNQLYRLIKLNTEQTPPANAVSCMPASLPLYCVVPVPGTYDRPVYGYFSLDGAQVYVLNCGVECGGATTSVSTLNTSALRVDNYDTTTSPVRSNTLVPGATVAIADGNTLYVAGQQLLQDGMMSGVLSSINTVTGAVGGPWNISDGTHTKMLFADDNTLWIGSQNCASGERYKTKANYNCLTRFDRGSNTPSIVPAVNPNSGTATVPYPNTNGDQYYYGSLTGICWIQNFHKIYTAYGGQVHIFNTKDGSEINNYNVTVQGTALDVAYPDAATNAAN